MNTAEVRKNIESSDNTFCVQSGSDIEDEKEIPDTLYANILKDIRDMNVLSSYQLHYLRGISTDKLIYIIGVYNKIIRNVNEFL